MNTYKIKIQVVYNGIEPTKDLLLSYVCKHTDAMIAYESFKTSERIRALLDQNIVSHTVSIGQEFDDGRFAVLKQDWQIYDERRTV